MKEWERETSDEEMNGGKKQKKFPRLSWKDLKTRKVETHNVTTEVAVTTAKFVLFSMVATAAVPAAMVQPAFVYFLWSAHPYGLSNL